MQISSGTEGNLRYKTYLCEQCSRTFPSKQEYMYSSYNDTGMGGKALRLSKLRKKKTFRNFGPNLTELRKICDLRKHKMQTKTPKSLFYT